MFNLAYRNDNGPLTYFRGMAVYLATIVGIVHFAALLAGVIAGPGVWTEWFFFMPALHLPGEFWRVLTWPFINSPSAWTIVGLLFVITQGREIESTYGRKVFGLLYAVLMAIPAAVCIAWWALFRGEPEVMKAVLAGASFVHNCLFLGVAFMHPRACLFGIPWLQLRWIALIFFIASALQMIADRNWPLLIAYLGNCAITYRWLRWAGMGTRFDGVKEALRGSLPEPRPRPGPRLVRREDDEPERTERPAKGRVLGGSGKYQPKIKPRAELLDDWQEVQDIDHLLEKISRDGMESLTDAERAALKKASDQLRRRENDR